MLLIDEFGRTTQASWLSANQFTAWGQTATIAKDGFLTKIVWDGNTWESGQIGGKYLVASNSREAQVVQQGDVIYLTDEFGNTTKRNG